MQTRQEIADLVSARLSDEYHIEISKTIGLGDAGTPFHLVIDVEYKIPYDKTIVVTSCMERECPYDNPSDKWSTRIGEIVVDYLSEKHPEIVNFHFD